MAHSFAETVPPWIEGKFEVLDPTLIENKTDEWQGELKRLSKTELCSG